MEDEHGNRYYQCHVCTRSFWGVRELRWHLWEAHRIMGTV